MLRRVATSTSSSASSTARMMGTTTVPLATPPPLPEPQTITVGDGQCVIEYVDVPSNSTETASVASAQPTVVLIHGAPGTYRDFRHMIPLLSARARVVALNLPGFGGSRAVEPSEYYAQIDSTKAAQSIFQAVATICKDDANVFVLGHSFGGHTAIQLTKLARDHAHPNVKGLALLASAGHRPHQSLAPRTAYVMAQVVKAEIPLVSWAMAALIRWVMTTFIGFPRSQPTGYFVSGLLRQTTADYDRVMAELRALGDATPTFYAWSRNDVHIEEEISCYLNDACAGRGPRIVFEKGGHNIQKTRAPLLAHELLTWMDAVVAGRSESVADTTPRVVE